MLLFATIFDKKMISDLFIFKSKIIKNMKC